MKFRLLAALVLSAAFAQQGLANNVEFQRQTSSLGDLAREISQRSGTEIVVADDLKADKVPSTVSAGTWETTIQDLLGGYNYEAQWNTGGKMSRVIVSGRNGNGASVHDSNSRQVAEDLLSYVSDWVSLPDRYQALNSGAVMPVTLPARTLLSMHLGERIAMNLPNGRYEVVHDNRFEHENGDVTWVGYLENGGTAFRVILTLGANGELGQIVTPEGTYNVESQDGRTWLVDLNAAGLQVSSLENDDTAPGAVLGSTSMQAKARKAVQKTSNTKTGTTASTSQSSASTTPVIDLMVLYTKGLKGAPDPATRINNLVAKANQAYIDSKINLKLRVVFSTLVAYVETNSNDTALSDLTNGRSVFGSVGSLRAQYGADLVTLLRPFNYKSQLSCGVAWVNGAGGSSMSAKYGFSVVSDGTDPGGSYYCSDYTMAHELGHNMGSAHDIAHSNVQGRYPFSYGYGFSGKFGTIMSYYNPTMGFFSSPNLVSNKQVLGAATADNVQSINLTAPVVAGFVAAVVK